MVDFDRLKRYSRLRKVYLVLHRFCIVDSPNHSAVAESATDIHHARGRDGDRLFDEDYFVPCCRECHEFIEANPDWATAKGYTKSRLHG